MNKNRSYTVGDLIYDANIYDGINTSLNDLQFYTKWLPKDKNAKVLELCCGTGRLTIPIAKAGYKVTGVDYTSTMLEQAKTKAEMEGLNIQFIEDDIRSLNLSGKYDTILLPFNSIHHMYENQDILNVLTIVKKHLNTGGCFLFDCFNPNLSIIVHGEQQLKKLAKFKTADGRDILVKQIMNYESSTQINRIEWHFYINGKFDSVQNMDMRLIFPQELDNYIKLNGFEIAQKFGSFDEDKFDNNSDKQIFVCRLENSIV